MLRGDVKDVLLLDVTPLSLGIETKGGVMTKLIERNTTIPTRRTEVFTTAEDGQPSVEIHVLQGEREMASYNKTLGKFQLVDLPPAPRGIPQIEVTFDIDANGIVHVSAKDRATNKEQSMTITGQSTLSKDDINQMVRDAESHAEEDRTRRDEAEIRNNADSLVYQTEKVLREQGDNVSADERSAVETPLADLKKALEGTDSDAIKTASDAADVGQPGVQPEAVRGGVARRQRHRHVGVGSDRRGRCRAPRATTRSSTPRSSTMPDRAAAAEQMSDEQPTDTERDPLRGRSRRSRAQSRRRAGERDRRRHRSGATHRRRDRAPRRRDERPPTVDPELAAAARRARRVQGTRPTRRRPTSTTTASEPPPSRWPRPTGRRAASSRRSSRCSTPPKSAYVQHPDEVGPLLNAMLGELRKHGLETLDLEGKPFDPEVAESVAHEPIDGGDLVVADVLRSGYRWKGRTLRPAMVRTRD